MSEKRLLLFAPAAFSLAETSRMTEIAKGVRDHPRASKAFDIHFISEGGSFERLIEELGFPITRVEPRLTEEQIARLMAINDEEKFGAVYSKREMIAKVTGDRAALRELKPAAVVTGSYLSMPLACRLENVPLVWTVQSTWLPGFFGSGAGLTDGLRPAWLKHVVDIPIFWAIRLWMWYGFIHSVNQAARHFGAAPYASVFDFFEGDIALVAEPPGFSDQKLPPRHYYIGPLIPQETFELPKELTSIPRDKPLIWFAMGSSGVGHVVKDLIESFRDKPYRVIAPVMALIDGLDVDIPENVTVTGWLPALQVNRMADIALIHGGIGTVLTAALAGKPIVGVGMQPEQVANIACLERKGFAIRVPKSRDPARLVAGVQAALERLLNDGDAKRRAADYAASIADWQDAPHRAADLILARYAALQNQSVGT